MGLRREIVDFIRRDAGDDGAQRRAIRHVAVFEIELFPFEMARPVNVFQSGPGQRTRTAHDAVDGVVLRQKKLG